jgi:hypothetical protein
MKLLSAAALGAMACLAMPLAGCTTLNQITSAYTAITDASVPASTVIIAANGFDAVEATAKNILAACTPASRPAVCNDVSLRAMIKAVKAGRAARDGLEGFLAAHPGQLGSKGLYDGLTAATATLTAAIAAYNAGASS